MTHRDHWAFARLLAVDAVNGELEAVSVSFRRLADHLAGLTLVERQAAFDAYLCNYTKEVAGSIVKALADIDPIALPPEAGELASYATLADIARIMSDQPWLWEGWIARDVLNVVASEPGTGKTRFAFDLARRLFLGLDWPDGQTNDLPKGSRTLWVQADRAFPEMLQTARDYGLPEEAVVLGSSPEDPTAGLDLDDSEGLINLAERIKAAGPALVIIDTVGMTTARNLCRPEEAREFFAPLLELARETGVALLGLTHLSKGGEALGRRIVEKARVVIKMTQPDPEGQPNRRRMWVDKTAFVKPPPLGITMGDKGNDYDHTPPTEPEASKSGRPPEERAKAEQFIRAALSQDNDQTWNLLRKQWEER